MTDTAFIQQHVVRGRNAVGVDVAMPACVVVTVAGELIARLEEYFDSRHLESFSELPATVLDLLPDPVSDVELVSVVGGVKSGLAERATSR